jgi:hypothetical protein
MTRLCIRFKKGAATVLECTRTNGSVTWQKILPAMVLHDLGHYVVETRLNFTNGFYGLLAQGWDIPDFDKPREQRPIPLLPKNLPREALLTEYIVNILLTGMQPGSVSDELFNSLKLQINTAGLSTENDLNLNQFIRMQEDLKLLSKQWESLPNKEILELHF